MDREYASLFDSETKTYAVIFRDPGETAWSYEARDLSAVHAQMLIDGFSRAGSRR